MKIAKVRLTSNFFEKIEIFEIFEKNRKCHEKFSSEKPLENHIGSRKNQNFGSRFFRFFRSQNRNFQNFEKKVCFSKKKPNFT